MLENSTFSVDLTADLKKYLPTSIHDKRGCYMLVWQSNGQANIIQRIFEEDKTGTLYIGKASNLLKRVKSLKRAIQSNADHEQEKPKPTGHRVLSRNFYRVRERFNPNDFQIRVIEMDSEEPEMLESYLIEKYVSVFGELPPLNGQYGKYHYHEVKEHFEHINLDLWG